MIQTTVILTLRPGVKLILDGETQTATILGRGEAGTVSLAMFTRLVRDPEARARALRGEHP